MSDVAEPNKHQSDIPKHDAVKLNLDIKMGNLYPDICFSLRFSRFSHKYGRRFRSFGISDIIDNYTRTPLILLELHLYGRQLSGFPIIRICLALRGNLSRILQKLTCLEITVFRIKYSRVSRLLELQIRRHRKFWTQVLTVKIKSRNSNYQYSLFSKKNPIFRIFCLSGWLGVPINPVEWSSTVIGSYRSKNRTVPPPPAVLLEPLDSCRW
jgi:hypothetical protein